MKIGQKLKIIDSQTMTVSGCNFDVDAFWDADAPPKDGKIHLDAVTSISEFAKDFGISPENTLGIFRLGLLALKIHGMVPEDACVTLYSKRVD